MTIGGAAPSGNEAVVQVMTPGLGVHSHPVPVAELTTRPAGSRSVTVAPPPADGPRLVTVRVNWIGSLISTVESSTVLSIAKSVLRISVSVSVEALLPRLGSVTPAAGEIVAVLASVPLAVGSICATTVKVAELPASRSTRALIGPVPPSGQAAPADGRHDQAKAVTPIGNGSATRLAGAWLGPTLVTTIW